MLDAITLDDRQKKIVLEVLKKHIPDASVWAFGSRVRGHARQASDLDLVIMNTEKINRAVLLDVKEAFDESLLDIKMDILLWYDAPAYLQESIQNKHARVQGEMLSPNITSLD